MRTPTVLCVDDDASIREFYGALLERHGYQVIAAQDAHHALQLFRANAKDVDVVITDYKMPGMDGLELAALLKQENPAIPIFMISGSHTFLDDTLPFVDVAMNKGGPVLAIVERLQSLIRDSI